MDLNSLSDEVNRPRHYTMGKIECIDFIEDQKFNYNIGNAVKYLVRYRHKGTPDVDLRKAIAYIERELKNL